MYAKHMILPGFGVMQQQVGFDQRLYSTSVSPGTKVTRLLLTRGVPLVEKTNSIRLRAPGVGTSRPRRLVTSTRGVHWDFRQSFQVVRLRELKASWDLFHLNPTLNKTVFIPVAPLKPLLDFHNHCLPLLVLARSGEQEIIHMSRNHAAGAAILSPDPRAGVPPGPFKTQFLQDGCYGLVPL